MVMPLLLHGRHAGPHILYQPFGPWIVPWRFGSLEEEYLALRTGVGLIDDSTQALLEVQGADRTSFLHNLLTNDIKRLTPGTGCRSALLTPNAKLIAEFLVLVDPSSIWLLCDATRTATVAQTLERYLFSEHVTLINHEREAAVLALQGPRTMAVLSQLFDAPIALPRPGDHTVGSLEHLSVRLIHHTLTGEAGVLCIVKSDDTHALWNLLLRRGQSQGLVAVGWDALNVARIEAGIPWFGIDLDASHLLPETGLENELASDVKGCYVGQEIVARMQTYGSANKKLMGLHIEGARVPAANDRIAQQEEEVGHVTSACFSLTLKQPIAMGYIKRGAYEPGTAVEIVCDGARVPAIVAARPLVPLERGRVSA